MRLVGMFQGSSSKGSGLGKSSSARVRTFSPSPMTVRVIFGRLELGTRWKASLPSLGLGTLWKASLPRRARSELISSQKFVVEVGKGTPSRWMAARKLLRGPQERMVQGGEAE